MPKGTAFSYAFSLVFYGMGYLKTVVIDNAIIEPINTYDFTINASLATGYFVLAIFFALTGSLFLYVQHHKDREITKKKDFELKAISARRSDDKRRESIPELNAKLIRRPKYGLDLYRRISS